jgi:hypothetical protein
MFKPIFFEVNLLGVKVAKTLLANSENAYAALASSAMKRLRAFWAAL